MAGPIRISILAAAAGALAGIRNVREETRRLGRDADGANGPVRRMGATVGKLTSAAAGAARTVGAAVAPIAGIASAAVAAAPALAAAGAAVLNVARAAGGAAPALAAIAAAGLFVKLTLTRIAPAIGKALEPVAKAFDKASAAAGKLAANGVRPLAREFAKVGIPIVSDAMNQIATSTNKVVKGFLRWTNSTPGLVALRKITGSAADAFADVAPHVLALATALGEMLGRISGVSLAAGSSGLSKVLDLVTAKLKTITGASVQAGLDTLRNTFNSVRDVVVKVAEVVGVAIRIYRQYQAQIMIISDVLAVLAIVFGGPVTAIIAAVGLIVRHLDTIKAALAGVRESFAKPGNVAFLDNIRTAIAVVWPAVVAGFNQIKAAVLPVLKEIVAKVRVELIPALGEFIAAAAPVVAFFIQKFAPIIAIAFRTVGAIISSAVTVITGIFKVLTGILTGDWSKTWDGIKTILRGALGILKALISGAFAILRGYFNAFKGVVAGIWRGLWALVRDAASTASANVRALISGMVTAVVGRFTALRDAISARMRSALDTVRSIVGRIKSAFQIDLFAAGARIVQSIINGIKSRAGAVVDSISGIAKSIRDHFPFSPAKRGPLKNKPMGKAGQNIARDLAKGMLDRQSLLRSATSTLARTVGAVDQVDLGLGSATRRPAGLTIQNNFHGVVGDPAAVGREVERVVNRYRELNGRAKLA